MALVLPMHENEVKDKHVESLWFLRLDEGSIPSRSTRVNRRKTASGAESPGAGTLKSRIGTNLSYKTDARILPAGKTMPGLRPASAAKKPQPAKKPASRMLPAELAPELAKGKTRIVKN